MHNKVELQPAYLLHSRPYRDTSVLLDFFTPDHGRVSVMGKGVRRPTSKLRGLLQPFNPLLISFSGKSSLKTLTHAESAGLYVNLTGQALFSAMYLNELLCRLLHEHEKDHVLFELYSRTLLMLAHEELEPVLRSFELDLLDSLGYGIALDADARHGDAVEASRFYFLVPELGVIRAEDGVQDNVVLFRGEDLLAIAHRDFSEISVRKAAKQLLRQCVNNLLGDRPLKSRRLFAATSG